MTDYDLPDCDPSEYFPDRASLAATFTRLAGGAAAGRLGELSEEAEPLRTSGRQSRKPGAGVFLRCAARM